jgi:hypothetical protein
LTAAALLLHIQNIKRNPMADPVCAGTQRVSPVLSFAVAAVIAAATAEAQQQTPPPDAGLSLDVEVIAKQLDIARTQIQPNLGATVYDFNRQAIETQPQGDNQSLNQLLLQAPGVAQDSFGQIHVRGDHANLQYRINGVQLPEGINVFGQSLETRLANSVALITGALPAQYGLRTAGSSTSRRRPERSPRAARSRYTAASSRGFSRVSNSAAPSAKSITT